MHIKNTEIISIKRVYYLLGLVLFFIQLPAVTNAQIRVMSYNVHYCVGMDNKNSIKGIAAAIKKADPDIVGLQEISDSLMADEIGRLTGMKVVFGPSKSTMKDYGDAILSKYPFEWEGNYSIPSASSSRYQAMAVRIDFSIKSKNLGAIRLINTHFDWLTTIGSKNARLATVDVIEEAFFKNSTIPTILTGDLNSEPDSETIDKLKKYGWVNSGATGTHYTRPSENPTKQIDYVLFRPANKWTVDKVHVVNGELSSDHLPIVADLIVKTSNSTTYQTTPKNQRVIIIMIDGFDPNYLRSSNMPFLKRILQKGFYKEVDGVMPSVTTVNNASINCGVWPAQHGIVGNTFFDVKDNAEKLMEDTLLLLAPTIFERAQKFNIKSALFSSKLKTIKILSKGTDIAISPEMATPYWVNAIGPVPDKYSADVNYWTCRALVHSLKTRPDIGLYYLHTTDYPMHMWNANDSRSLKHLHTLDSLLSVMAQTAPDAAIFITADHGMNHKTKVFDLKNVLADKGLPVKAAISPLKDLYPKHHSGFGGVAYVFLQNEKDSTKVRSVLSGLKGVEAVLSNKEFSEKYHQNPERTGYFIVLGDKQTVFGELENKKQTDTLPDDYRTHGSLYEIKVPLFIYNINPPPAAYFKNNLDLARWLY